MMTKAKLRLPVFAVLGILVTALIMTSISLLPPASAATPSPTPVTLQGDLNCDSHIDCLDLILLQIVLNGATPPIVNCSSIDISKDGKITTADRDALIKIILGLANKPGSGGSSGGGGGGGGGGTTPTPTPTPAPTPTQLVFFGTDTYPTNTTDGIWTVPANVTSVSVLVVAGGGGGGGVGLALYAAGGGGGGGVVYNVSYPVSPGADITVTVGAGGNGGAGSKAGDNGEDSAFGAITAVGGGGGGTTTGQNGGSGGGGGMRTILTYGGGSGTSEQGNNGGGSYYTCCPGHYAGGGGGGAGETGNAGDSSSGGNGGAGADYSSIFGTGVGANGWFAAGGGGGDHSAGGAGGTGGGANGSSGNGNGNDATGNGSGGGGAYSALGSQKGGSGSAGIVIVRYVPNGSSVPALRSIAVTPARTSIVVNGTKQFIANGSYSDGSYRIITSSVTWNSSNAGVATISSSGLAAGIALGTANISASLDGVTSNSATLNVTDTPPNLISIAVTPTTASTTVNGTQQFTANGSYSDGSYEIVTSSVTWNTSNAGVATISSSGLATGIAGGVTNISASLSGVTSNNATLNVTDITLISIAVTPTTASIAVDGTQQFTANGSYSDGSHRIITASVIWNTDNSSVAVISSAGLATAMAAGSANISASLSGVTSNNATLTVFNAPPSWVYKATYSSETSYWKFAWLYQEEAKPAGTGDKQTYGGLCDKYDIRMYSDADCTNSMLPQRSARGSTIYLVSPGWDMRSITDRQLRLRYNAASLSAGGASPITNNLYYRLYDPPATFGAPYTLGESWSFTEQVDSSLLPGDTQPPHNQYSAAVASATESITVPAGTFTCYKITFSLGGNTIIEWWDSEGRFTDAPVKIVDSVNFANTETKELQSSTALP